jgi:DNA invertase Pin-like site-specific DNA recombinase
MSELIVSPGWASYLRVSDEDKQTPERSFAFQRKHIQDNLLANSTVEFKREYCDMLTGTSPNRADYQEMLADAQAGKFSHLGLYRADRFGRNAVEGLQAATRLISWGVKVRVANMPTLQPETPDGFFMFLLQMGLAQREVDVLRERTRDGMEAKMRMGGWPSKAPFGYVNKERLVSSNKYDRWVEQDPKMIQGLKDAWDLLLTGRYTLDQICEELTQRGYTTYSGRPWAWNDLKTGYREFASNRLHKILHNPFYAGWVTSKRFGIVHGEVRGSWDAIITPNEYQKGLDILSKHGSEKSYERKQFYLLRGLLWVEVDGQRFKLHGSTPRGRSQSYSYYITRAKPGGTSVHIPTKLVDDQIRELLQGIEISADLIPEIRKIYVQEVQQFTNQDRDKQVADLRHRLAQLKEEETRLGRLLITGKITEEAYDKLRLEWQEKLRNAELSLAELERDAKVHLDDLDLAIGLLNELVDYYFWLEEKQKSTLLQILFKRIIVIDQGQLIDYELNSPFVYLRSLADGFNPPPDPKNGSVRVREGAYAKMLMKQRPFLLLAECATRRSRVAFCGSLDRPAAAEI